MKTLIVGMGQVGTALYNVLEPYYEVHTLDKNEILKGVGIDIMHICFPYSEAFNDDVRSYQEKYEPRHTIIHSTVPVGTSAALGAIHSPVRGIHPKLESGIKTFVKFLGGGDASEVADYFRKCDIKVYLFDKAETTELMKILSTDFYGVLIEWTKQVKRHCDENEVPFSAWTLWTDTYNKGYKKLGHPEYTRPNLVPIMKKIGGHCIRSNAEFIKDKFTKLIRKQNGI